MTLNLNYLASLIFLVAFGCSIHYDPQPNWLFLILSNTSLIIAKQADSEDKK